MDESVPGHHAISVSHEPAVHDPERSLLAEPQSGSFAATAHIPHEYSESCPGLECASKSFQFTLLPRSPIR
jgi:hypothetical protein